MAKNEKTDENKKPEEWQEYPWAEQSIGMKVASCLLLIFITVSVFSIGVQIVTPIITQQAKEIGIERSRLLRTPIVHLPTKSLETMCKTAFVPFKAMSAMVTDFDPRPLLTAPSDMLRAMLLIEPEKLPPLSPEVEALIATK